MCRHVDRRADKCADMYADMYADMCADICVDMCVDMCTDMWVLQPLLHQQMARMLRSLARLRKVIKIVLVQNSVGSK